MSGELTVFLTNYQKSYTLETISTLSTCSSSPVLRETKSAMEEEEQTY